MRGGRPLPCQSLPCSAPISLRPGCRTLPCPPLPPAPAPGPPLHTSPPLPLYVCKNDESNVFFLLLERCAVMSVLSSPAPAPAPAHPILPWPPDPALPYTSPALLNGEQGVRCAQWCAGAASLSTSQALEPMDRGCERIGQYSWIYPNTMLKDGKISDFPAFLTGCWGCAWGTPGMRILTWFRSLCAYWRGWQLRKVGFMVAKSTGVKKRPKTST